MAGSNPAYSAILNDLNRDVSREQPTDIIQFCADWFQDKLREEVRAQHSVLAAQH